MSDFDIADTRWNDCGELVQELDYGLDEHPTDAMSLDDIATIIHGWGESEDGQWALGQELGPESSIALVGKLKDGRWFAATGWADYTGWDCQSALSVTVRDTEAQVVLDGLTNEERGLFGYPALTADAHGEAGDE